MATKDLVKHSYSNAPSQKKLNELIASAGGITKLLFILAGKYTMRSGEMQHMQTSWLHIDDDEAKKWRVNHIQIPQFGEYCDCDVCMMNEWIKYQKKRAKVKVTIDGKIKLKKRSKFDKTKVKMSHAWYVEQQYKYFELKEKGKLPNLPKHKWNPKTTAGTRLIPLVFEEYTSFIQDFFSKNESIGVSRQTMWRKTKDFAGDYYLHAFRSSAVQNLVDRGIDDDSLLKICGWGGMASAQPYRTRKTEDMIANAKEIAKK